jgi:hypothetical protein
MYSPGLGLIQLPAQLVPGHEADHHGMLNIMKLYISPSSVCLHGMGTESSPLCTSVVSEVKFQYIFPCT